jgi:hypothetical protein
VVLRLSTSAVPGARLRAVAGRRAVRDTELVAPAEHVLGGGNVADSVVRVGATVRKPATPATPAIEALLRHLHAAGFAGAPCTLGRDERGRHVLEYIPGRLADTMPPLDHDGLYRVGGLIRELHDKAQDFTAPAGARWNVVIPPDRSDLVCHHDLAPWNLVRDGDRDRHLGAWARALR